MGIVRNESPYLFRRYGEFKRLEDNIIDEIQKELESYDEEYLFNIDEDELTQKLVSKYLLKPIRLNEERINKFSKDEEFYVDPDLEIGFLERKKVKGTKIIIEIPFEGSSEVFHYTPTSFSTVYPQGIIRDHVIRVEYLVFAEKGDNLKKQYEWDLKVLKDYIKWINKDIERFNEQLQNKIKQLIKRRKEKLLTDKKILETL